MTTAVEKAIPARNIRRWQSPMELLTPRELSQTTEVRPPTTSGRVTIPDPSDTLGDPVVEQTVRKLIETVGRLVANRNAPGSGVTAPYGRIDDTGRLELSQETIKKTGADSVTLPAKTSAAPEMMMCLFTTLWQKFKCAVLAVCTIPMSTRTLTSAGMKQNEGVIRWNSILRNLASRNAGQMILMDIEHELRAMDQARLTTDGIHFDSIERQAWMNPVFQERLDEMEVELFDTGVLKKEETTNEPALLSFVPPPPNLETRLGAVPAATYRPQSSSEPGQKTYVLDRLGEAPVRRTVNPRRRLGPVNPTKETTGTSRPETRSENTSTSREERRTEGSSLMCSRPIPSPWHVYKQDQMKLNFQTVRFAADAKRMLNGATLSINGLHSIAGVDWLIAAGINFTLHDLHKIRRFRGTALKQHNGSSNCKTFAGRETESW